MSGLSIDPMASQRESLPAWNAVIGLRNWIVHGYMNVDMSKVLELVAPRGDKFITDFLLKAITPNETAAGRAGQAA